MTGLINGDKMACFLNIGYLIMTEIFFARHSQPVKDRKYLMNSVNVMRITRIVEAEYILLCVVGS